jgi:DNA-binding XRE family transcriptional regulator
MLFLIINMRLYIVHFLDKLLKKKLQKNSILQAPLHRLVISYSRGHFCNFLPSTYQFSKPLNPLDYDPTYPKNPTTLGEYIRKYRKDKGLLIRELAKEIGIHKFTLIKWEGGRMPPKYLKKLRKAIPGLASAVQDSYQQNAT